MSMSSPITVEPRFNQSHPVAATQKLTYEVPHAQPDPARTAAVEAYRRALPSMHGPNESDNLARQPSRKHRAKGSEGSHFEEARRRDRLSHSKSLASIKAEASRGLDRGRSNHRSGTSAKLEQPLLPMIPVSSVKQTPLFARPLRKAKSDLGMIRRKSVAQSWTPIAAITNHVQAKADTYHDALRYVNGSSVEKKDPRVAVGSPIGESKRGYRDSTSLKSTLRSYKSFTNAFKRKAPRSITSVSSPISYDTSLPPFNFAYDEVPMNEGIKTPELPSHEVSIYKRSSSIKSRLKKFFGRTKDNRSDATLPVQHVPARQFHFNVNVPADDHEESVPGVRYTMSDSKCRTVSTPIRLVEARDSDESTQFTSWNSSYAGGRSSYALSSRKTRQATSEESKRLYSALRDQIASQSDQIEPEPSPAKSTRSVATVVAREVKTFHLDRKLSRTSTISAATRPSSEWRSWMSDQMGDMDLGLETHDLVLDLPKTRAQVPSVAPPPSQSVPSSTSSRHRIRRISSSLANRFRGASGQSENAVVAPAPVEPPWADIALPPRPHNTRTRGSSGHLSLFPAITPPPTHIASPVSPRASLCSEMTSTAGDTVYRFPDSRANVSDQISPFEDQTLHRISQGPYAHYTSSPGGQNGGGVSISRRTPTKSTPTPRKPVSRSQFSSYSAFSASSKENTAPLQYGSGSTKDSDLRTIRTIRSMRILRERSSTRSIGGKREQSASPGQRMADEFLNRSGRGLRSQTSSPMLGGSSPRFI